MARLPSLVQTRGGLKKPSPKPSGGVLAFLHRLRVPHRNKVAHSTPSSSRASYADTRPAWQALQEDSGSEDHKVRSACQGLCRVYRSS